MGWPGGRRRPPVFDSNSEFRVSSFAVSPYAVYAR